MLTATDYRYAEALKMMYCSGFVRQARAEAKAWTTDGWASEQVRTARFGLLVPLLTDSQGSGSGWGQNRSNG